MNRFIQLFILFSGMLGTSFAQQTNHASNVQVKTDDSSVLLVYDLYPNGTHRAFDVSVSVNHPNIRPRMVQGTGTVIAGLKRSIEWYYTADGYTTTDVEGLKIGVLAIDPLESEEPPIPVAKGKQEIEIPLWAGLDKLAITAVGLLGSGGVMESDALQDHRIYKEHTSENAAIYRELGISREELYQQANLKHKRAQAMALGGGAVLIAGVVVLIRRANIRKRIRNGKYRANAWEVTPLLDTEGILFLPNTNSAGSVGLQLGWKF